MWILDLIAFFTILAIALVSSILLFPLAFLTWKWDMYGHLLDGIIEAIVEDMME